MNLPEPDRLPVAALVEDLLFASKISATAAHVGTPVRIVFQAAQLREQLGGCGGLILDLNVSGEDVLQLATQACRANPALRVAAFVPHVDARAARQARDAGIARVLTRSAFTEQLPQLLRELSGA